MKKLVLKKEQLTELSTADLGSVRGAAPANTVADTNCGWECCGTTPINQCLISVECILDTVS